MVTLRLLSQKINLAGQIQILFTLDFELTLTEKAWTYFFSL